MTSLPYTPDADLQQTNCLKSKSMCTIIIKVFKNIKAIPACVPFTYHCLQAINPLSQGDHIAPGDQKKLCFTMLSLIPMVSIARLSVVKQSSFGLPGQYGRRVTRVNTH